MKGHDLGAPSGRPAAGRTNSPRAARQASDPDLREILPGPEPPLGTLPRRLLRAERVDGVIPVCDSDLSGNERAYLMECVESGWVSSRGPFVERFERAFAEAVGCEHAVACSSGTAALHLALAALGLGPGDEVILPAFTMIAVVNAVDYVGARPVLVDVDPETWNLDPAAVEARVGSCTRAVLAVHTYGHPADMEPLLALARARRLRVIEDVSEAHGAEYHGQRLGSLGHVAAFSFYANKIVTTGEGGMMTTGDTDLAAQARELRGLAFSAERHFWHKRRGFNYRMSSLQAAVGLAQTERLSELVERRRRAARLYAERLRGVPGLTLPVERPGAKNVYWMYGVVVGDDFGCTRDALRRYLAERGVETRSFFVPLHLQPVCAPAFAGERYPVSEALCARGLYLPSGPLLSEAEIDYVSDAIRSAPRASRPGD